MNIYIICPVRGGTPEGVMAYVEEREARGDHVHFPVRDAPQDDPTGWNICSTHRAAIIRCDEIHVFWDVSSYGSHFDLGMAFSLGKRIVLVKTYHPDTDGKSYIKVMEKWQCVS